MTRRLLAALMVASTFAVPVEGSAEIPPQQSRARVVAHQVNASATMDASLPFVPFCFPVGHVSDGWGEGDDTAVGDSGTLELSGEFGTRARTGYTLGVAATEGARGSIAHYAGAGHVTVEYDHAGLPAPNPSCGDYRDAIQVNIASTMNFSFQVEGGTVAASISAVIAATLPEGYMDDGLPEVTYIQATFDSGGNARTIVAGSEQAALSQNLTTQMLLTPGSHTVAIRAEARIHPDSLGEFNEIAELSWNVGMAFDTACNDRGGQVLDGAPADRHANPLPDTLVEIVPVGGGAPIQTTQTSLLGRFCYTEPSVPYDIKVVLREARQDAPNAAPMVQTHHANDSEPVSASFRFLPGLWLDATLELSEHAFRLPTSTAPIERLSHIADVHRRSVQYARFLRSELGVTPARFGTVKVRTWTERDASVYSLGEVELTAIDSDYGFRDDPFDIAPENGEWHEITHHLTRRYGVADADEGVGCLRHDGNTNHGGWANHSTCDSLSEGFAEFLPTLARQRIDGATDSHYAWFGSLESGTWKAWTHSARTGRAREEMAVAAALWDLVDSRRDFTRARVWRTGSTPVQVSYRDDVQIDARTLWTIMTEGSGVDDVADLVQRLKASTMVPTLMRTRNIDLDRDGTNDATAVDIPFLARGFHVSDPRLARARRFNFRIGSIPGRTDHVVEAGALVPRHALEPEPGSSIRFRNDSASPVLVRVTMSYPSGVSTVGLSVDPGGETFNFEMPPHFSWALDDGEQPPSCAQGDESSSVTFDWPGAEPVTIDACTFFFAVRASNGQPIVDLHVGYQPITVTPATDPGTVEVAILSSNTFAAPERVDLASLRFGITGDEDSIARTVILPDCDPLATFDIPDHRRWDLDEIQHPLAPDADGDGINDVVCRFDLDRAAVRPGTSTVFLTGTTNDGTVFRGRQQITLT